MDPQLCQFIENEQHLLSNYDQLLHVNVNDVLVDISCSIGPNAVTPPGLDDQPPSYPAHSKYRFPTKHKGSDALDEILNILKKGCTGCNTIHHKNGVGRHKNTHQLQCSKYRLNDVSEEETFAPGKYRQEGTKVETIKNSKSVNKKENAFSRMNHHKLKGQKKKTTADRRSQKVKKSPPKVGHTNERRRTQSYRANSAEYRCHMNLMFSMNITTGYWFLHSNSNLRHSFHLELSEESSKLTKKDLSPSHLDMVFEMYNNSVPNSQITNIMTNLMNKSGTDGEFLPDTMRHITNDLEEVMKEIAHISGDFSVAEITIAKLNA